MFMISTFIFVTALFILIPLGIFGPFNLLPPLILLGLKVLFDYLVMKRGLKVFGLDDSLKYFLLTELIHIPYILTVAIGGQIIPHEWRGRRLGKKVD